MSLTITNQSQTFSALDDQVTGTKTLEAKPKKVNSEVRKQQNRIASRNYREKRKRKLQHLQHLLQDEDPAEQGARMRSTSPYEERSCSEPVNLEHPTTTVSPRIPAMLGGFGSPSFEYMATTHRAWTTNTTPSAEEPFTTNQSDFVHMAPYNAGYMASAPTWNVGTDYFSSIPTHQPTYFSHPPSWSSPGFEPTYSQATNQRGGSRDPDPYLSIPPWQSQEKLFDQTYSDQYSRRHRSYRSC